MIEYQTYTINFDPKDLKIALINTDFPPFLYPYHGDIFVFGQQAGDVNWEPGIHQIMEEYDEAWRHLARL
jgi:hypothetical protein